MQRFQVETNRRSWALPPDCRWGRHRRSNVCKCEKIPSTRACNSSVRRSELCARPQGPSTPSKDCGNKSVTTQSRESWSTSAARDENSKPRSAIAAATWRCNEGSSGESRRAMSSFQDGLGDATGGEAGRRNKKSATSGSWSTRRSHCQMILLIPRLSKSWCLHVSSGSVKTCTRFVLAWCPQSRHVLTWM